MPSAPDPEIILTDEYARDSSSTLNDGDDMFLTIDTLDSDFPAVERPRALVKKESLQKEKQVSVDPMSLVGSTFRQASFKLVSTPPRAPRFPGAGMMMSPPPQLPPPKLKFVSASLPSSASSSPRSRLSLSNKHMVTSPGCPQPWVMDDTDLALQEVNMRKSRSEGEGRTSVSADDFNIMLKRPSMEGTNYDQFNSFSKPETNYERRQSRNGKHGDIPEDGFKCGKLCLFLPRGKGKAVRASSSNSISSIASKMSSFPSHKTDSMPPIPPHKADRTPSIPSHKTEHISHTHSLKSELPVISRRVSLERFDLGSFSSSVMSDDEGSEPTSLFFDLPLEMIRYSVSDVQSPVTAAFVFDKDSQMESEPKGAPRNSAPNTDGRKSMSQDPSRHVRFSTSSSSSSPPYVSPRQKSIEDFNSFLEAQST